MSRAAWKPLARQLFANFQETFRVTGSLSAAWAGVDRLCQHHGDSGRIARLAIFNRLPRNMRISREGRRSE